MAKKLNSASRLSSVFEQANSIVDNIQTLDAWAKLLNIDEVNPNKRVILVGEQIHAMYSELELIVHGMEAANITKSIYENDIERVRHALSPMLLPSTWNNVKQYLAADVLKSFAYCSEILPDEESQISSEDIQEIKQRVGELKTCLDDNSLPPRLRNLIEHHIALIERALLEYPIAGAKVFREAGRTALGELIEAKDEIAPARDTEAVSRLNEIWNKVNKAVDTAIKTEKIAQIGQKAWEAISNIYETLGQ